MAKYLTNRLGRRKKSSDALANNKSKLGKILAPSSLLAPTTKLEGTLL